MAKPTFPSVQPNKLVPVLVLLVGLLGVFSVGIAVADGPVVDEGTVFEPSDDGPTVTITEELELDDPFYYPDDQTVDLSPHATFHSDGDTNVTVEQITGDFTNITTHDVSTAEITVDPADKQAVSVSDNHLQFFNFTDIDASNDENTELVYEAIEIVDFSITDLPTETTIHVIDVNQDEVVETQTTDENGEATFTLPGEFDGSGEVRFEADFGPEPDCSEVTYQDEDGAWGVGTLAELQCIGHEDTNGEMGDEYVLINDINAAPTTEWHQKEEFSEQVGSPIGNEQGDRFVLSYGIDTVLSATDVEDGSQVDVTIADQENGIIELEEETEDNLDITYTLSQTHQGFDPIGGEAEESQFAGTFDGQNNKITNIHVNRGNEDYVGLFAVVAEPGELRNVHLDEITMRGSQFVGGLAGTVAGNVVTSSTTGVVRGDRDVGGLVGSHSTQVGQGGSTPFVFAWDGEKYQFENELGQGLQWVNDPYDWIRIDRQNLDPFDGQYNLSITQEFNEVGYLDELALQTFDHEPGYTVVTSAIRDKRGEYRTISSDRRGPESCVDGFGNDCLDTVSDIDKQWTAMGQSNETYYNPIEIDFGDLSGEEDIHLVMRAVSDFNVEVSPENWIRTLQVPDDDGNWIDVVPDSQLPPPADTPRLMAINMSDAFPTDDYRVRLGMDRVQWNYLAVDTAAPTDFEVTTHHPSTAELQARGYSAIDKDSEPYWQFDYQNVSDTPEELYSYQSGNYTKYGDVSPLLQERDDKFVIMRYGDEVQLNFDRSEVPDGLERSYMMEGAIWYKHASWETGETVEPLPFEGMSQYPYDDAESYPDTTEYQEYLDEWNTRVYEPRSAAGETIIESYADTEVISTSGRAGGLVGFNNDLDIQQSLALGDVTNFYNGWNIGGLVGVVGSGDIVESYARGQVSAVDMNNDRVGGLVGHYPGSDSETVNSYATGTVIGQVTGGVGVASLSEYEGMIDSYWDRQSTGQDESAGDAIGLTTDEMQSTAAIDNMAFTFDEPWLATDEYPHLWWEVTDYSLTVSDTTLEPDDTTDSDVLVSLVADRQVGASSTSAYSSSDTGVVTIDDDGTVTAVSGGTADVQAQLGSYSDSVTIEVEEEEEPEEPTPEPAEAHFDVTITDTNSPLDPDETAVIDAEITNAGDGTGTQTIEFNVSDQTANESVTIAPGNSELVSFEWETTTDDIGSHTATVTSDDEADNTTISVTADHPTFVSAHVADATPAIVDITFDQDVSVDEDAPTGGFAVSLDGSSADLETASADGTDVALELAQDVDANQDILLSYDGDSNNVVNEHDLEALAFETGDIDNQVEVFQANLSAIDPTTNERSNRFSIETTVADGVILSAEDSILPPGQEATFDWEVGDESFTTTEPTLDRQFFEPGVYNASVTITVADRIRSAIFTLEVVDETPPDARLTAAETVEIGDDPNLDASESSDNVAIADFEWDFGDGTTDAGANLTQPEHAFDEPGEYEVTVTVTDTSGNSAQNSTTITVEEEPDEGMDVLPIGLALLVVAALAVAGYYYMRRR